MAIVKSTEITNTGRYPANRLNQRERKVLEVSEQYEPTTAADWTSIPGVSSAPSSQQDALDKLASAVAPNDIQEATGTLTDAEIKALNGTPIELIAAPGAGKAIVVEEIELFLDFNSAAYVADAGEDLTIEYATGGVDIATWDNDSDDILVGTADERRLNRPTVYDVLDLTTVDNEAVQAFIATGEVITGDSPIKWRLRYREVTLLT